MMIWRLLASVLVDGRRRPDHQVGAANLAMCQRGFDLAALVIFDVDREPFICRFPEVATGIDIEPLDNETANEGNVTLPRLAIETDALDQDRADAGGLAAIRTTLRHVRLPANEHGLGGVPYQTRETIEATPSAASILIRRMIRHN